MTDADREEPPDVAQSWLVHQWVVAGIVSAGARFVPIPFVDDLIRGRCRQYVVARTLAVHGRSEEFDDFEPFYDKGRPGCLDGCLGTAMAVPLKLLLYPVRKIVAVLTSVRGVPLEIMRVVLLGRTVDRQLRRGAVDSEQAERMRAAFEESFAGMDFRLAKAALGDALESVGGLKSAALKSARRLVGAKETLDVATQEQPEIDAGARQVQQALDRPDVVELFAEFDRRFDAALERV